MKRGLILALACAGAGGCAQNVEPFQQQNQEQVQQTSPPTDQRPIIIFWNGHNYPGNEVVRMISSELIEAAQAGDEDTVRELLGSALKTFAGVDDPARGGDAIGAESDAADERFASASSSTTVPAGTHSQSVVLNFFNVSDASTSGDQQGEASQTTEADQTVKAAVEAMAQVALQAQGNQAGAVEGDAGATGGAMDQDAVMTWLKNAKPNEVVEALNVIREIAPNLVPTVAPALP